MAVERMTPENLTRRAHAHAAFERCVYQAVEHLDNLRGLFNGTQPARLDPTTIQALDQAARLLRLDLIEARQRSEATARLADEAAGVPWEEDDGAAAVEQSLDYFNRYVAGDR